MSKKQIMLGALSSISLAVLAMPAFAADVTPQRLLHPDAEPQNWLMTHHDYNNANHSALTSIDKTNVRGMTPKFMFSIGGRDVGGTLPGKEEATPLVDDGYLYVTDTWARVMKFDVRNGTSAVPLWVFDPKITKSRTQRGVAFMNNNVYITTNDTRVIGLNRDSGEEIFEVQAAAPQDPTTGTPSVGTQGFTGPPSSLQTAAGKQLILQGESTGGQQGTRSWVGAWDAADGKLAWRFFTIPAPGEPGFETWKDNHNAWRTGGAGVWQTGSFDPDTNLVYYGTGDAFPSFDPEFRPGDNLYSASTIALDADTGKLKWYFQETPNEHWDFDTPNPKMIMDININGQDRKVLSNFSRNGFFYTLDRASGQFLRAAQYQEKVTWTAGIDPKTGRPVDYDPSKTVQNYAGVGGLRAKPGTTSCPWFNGAPTFYPPSYDAKRQIAYVAGAEGCFSGATIQKPMDPAKNYVGQAACCFDLGKETAHGALWAMNVTTGKVVNKAQFPIPEYGSGVLSTDGGVVFSGHPNGDLTAYDSDTLQILWNYNVGTPITAPPMTYSVGGKQYVAVVAGGGVGVYGVPLYQPSAMVVVFGL